MVPYRLTRKICRSFVGYLAYRYDTCSNVKKVENIFRIFIDFVFETQCDYIRTERILEEFLKNPCLDTDFFVDNSLFFTEQEP